MSFHLFGIQFELSQRFMVTAALLFIDIIAMITIKILLRFNRFKNLPFFLYPNYIFAIGIFGSLMVFFFMSYSSSVIARIADSLVSTVRVFGFDILINDLSSEEFYSTMKETDPDFTLFHLLRIFAPLITLRAALGIFRDYLTQIKYFFCFYREPHVFSELNEKSICLARDIYNSKKYIKPMIIFENITTKIEDADEGLILATKEIDALFTKRHILNFHLIRPFGKSPSVYLIDNDDHINLKNATNLYETYKKHKFEYYVFTTSIDSEFFIDALDKRNNKSKIQLINQPQIIAYNLMIEKPLFSGPVNSNSNKISVLVIGAGRIGMECAKTAMWCSRMQNYDFEIRIIDSVDREKEFEKEHLRFKEIIENAGIDLNYKFIQEDINSPEFVKCLHSYANYNYIIVATGNDELTINTAIKTKVEVIRKRVENSKYSFSNLPVIVPIILNDNYYELFKSYVANREDATMFFPFGVNSEIFSLKYIKNWFIDDIAMAYFNIYKGLPVNYYNKDYFIEPEYSKRSNRAAAIHSIYKLHDLGVSFYVNKDYKEPASVSGTKNSSHKKRILYAKTPDKYQRSFIKQQFTNFGNIERLLKTEHERWTIFTVLDGWSPWSISSMQLIQGSSRCPINTQKHKLVEAKLHGCIIKSEWLSLLATAKIPEVPSTFIEGIAKKAEAISPDKRTSANEHSIADLTAAAEEENEEKLKIFNNYMSAKNLKEINIFHKNDFGVCWFAYEVIRGRYDNIFYFED